MDKRKSILNISVSIGFKLVLTVLVILVRRLLIRACGNEVNGLNSLYLSLIGFLAVAELGVGSAITFCMYRPIVEGDHNKVSALYHLFRRLYLLIGGIILVAGLVMTPFIHYFARDYAQLDVDLRLTFLLTLISVVATYLFGAKAALFNAYKNNYISTAINSGGQVLQYALQIVTLAVTGSFAWYLVCRTVAAGIQWIATEWISRRKYSHILSNKQKIDRETRQELTKNIKAMFMHKIGSLLVFAVDSVVISAFVGVAALGTYSNYTTIQSGMDGVISLVFSSLISIFGHLYVRENKRVTKAYFEGFCLLNYALGTLFYLGFYAIIDNLVAMLFGIELIVSKTVVAVITVNGFVQFMRRNALAFREATGTFYHDRWKPLIEGALNLILSILFVNWLGITGVIVATIITNLLICHVVEPYVLYKYAFDASPKGYYLRNYSAVLFFVAALVLLDWCMVERESQWVELLINGCIAVGITLIAWLVGLCANWHVIGTIKSLVKYTKKDEKGSNIRKI